MIFFVNVVILISKPVKINPNITPVLHLCKITYINENKSV